MYLSRVWLDPDRRGARRLLASPQRIHAVVAGAASRHADDAGRPLWRLDGNSSGMQLLVVTKQEPDFTSLLEQCEMPPEDGWETTPYEPFLASLKNGQHWRFRLAANPVKSLREVTDPRQLTRGKRVPIVGQSGLSQWLLRRAAGMGVAIEPDGFALTEKRSESFNRRATTTSSQPERGQRVYISRAQFDGQLEVVDADAVRAALTEGVGSAKAYGCGLLTLAPL